MTKEWQDRPKRESNSFSGESKGALNKEQEANYSKSRDLSSGYADLSNGFALQETARTLQPTGQRRSANFSRITAEPIDGLVAPAKDGKPSVKEDSKNSDLANNKNASKGDDKSAGGNFQDNLISSTSYIGELYRIEVPAGLKRDDPLFASKIQIKMLVQYFGFAENDATELITYLYKYRLPTGLDIGGYTGLFHSKQILQNV